MPDVELITIGTELLLGFTIDTNSAFLGQALSALGMSVVRRTAVADRPPEIRAAVDEALTRSGFAITTGGLGPTGDDVSKHVVADLLGLPLHFDAAVWDAVLERYRRFGRVPVESNRGQAMVPAGAVVLPNRWGTAPGLWLDSPRGIVVMLPGVPHEMRMLVEHEVAPRLAARSPGTAIRSATLRTSGIPESTLAERVGDVASVLAPLTLAYLPSVTGVDLRLTAWNLPMADADARLRSGLDQLRARAPEWCYGEGTTDLAAVVLDQLRAAKDHLVVAESCTGGLLGGRITSVAGSSDVFLGGVISYDNRLKRDLLGVPDGLLVAHGAVSAEVVQAMASGAATRFGAEVALAVTGIAGPGGGSEEKPVGTVWFGVWCGGRVEAHRGVFGGNRAEIRARAVQAALLGLWRRLSG